MFLDKIKISIVGLGYVGLPLAAAFAKKFQVVGYDIDQKRVNDLLNGDDQTLEVDKNLLDSIKSNITFTSDMQDVKDCNIFIITVPTPIDKANLPDLTPLIQSSKAVGKVLKKDDIVIYESTVYPGVTRDICVPELEKSSGLIFNKDFYCGYSPERINPGDKEHTVTKILKVTSGSTPEIAEAVDNLYKEIITSGTYMASSIEVAEASKVVENTQRDVNIALINELAMIFDKMGIDTNEVIEAAATKWNFLKLSPGLVGGHCIGVDPYYLTFKAEEIGYKPNLILAARQINNGMAKYVADKTIKEMIKSGITIKGSSILILGITFKEDCSDIRNSKVTDIIEELKNFGAKIDIYDPWVTNQTMNTLSNYEFVDDPSHNKKTYDAIIVAVGHKHFKAFTNKDYENLSKKNGIIIDVKNIVEKPTWKL